MKKCSSSPQRPSSSSSPPEKPSSAKINDAELPKQPGQLEAQSYPEEPIVNDKTKLQDQTNLLPFKQVMVVFVGLSCALICRSDLTVCKIIIVS